MEDEGIFSLEGASLFDKILSIILAILISGGIFMGFVFMPKIGCLMAIIGIAASILALIYKIIFD